MPVENALGQARPVDPSDLFLDLRVIREMHGLEVVFDRRPGAVCDHDGIPLREVGELPVGHFILTIEKNAFALVHVVWLEPAAIMPWRRPGAGQIAA